MKLKTLFVIAITLISCTAFAQTPAAKQNQFILIIRSKADFKPSAEAIQTNVKHWQEFMGNLAKDGKIAGGYRPGNDGETISGTGKTMKSGAYVANGDVVSSFLVINAVDMAEAKQVAAKCPVFELQGSIEVRPILNTAN